MGLHIQIKYSFFLKKNRDIVPYFITFDGKVIWEGDLNKSTDTGKQFISNANQKLGEGGRAKSNGEIGLNVYWYRVQYIIHIITIRP